MVVNELTKSVQKKGAKTVVAVGLAALAAGAANAAAIDPGAAEHAGKTALAVWSDSNVPANLTADPFTMTGQQANIIAGQKNYADVLKITAGATGSYQNFDISMSATGPTDGKSQDKQLIVVHQVGGDVNFSGDSFKVNATTDFVGGGYNQFSGIYSQAPESQTLEISAAETSIKLTSTAKNGKAVYGISTAGGTVALTGGTVGIEVETNTERSTDEGATNEYSAIIGLGNSSIAGVKGYEEYTGHVTSGEATQISLTVKSNSEKPTVSNNSGAAGGGSPAYGIKLDGGSIDLKGSTTIDVSAVGANAYGVHAQNSEYSTSTGSQTFDSAGVIHNLTVDAKSKTGNAFGFYVMNAADSTNTVTMEATGDVSINASSASGNAFGIYASGKTTTTIGEDGKTVSISASGNKGYGILSSGEGRLTVLGKTIGVDADGAALQGVRAQAGSTVSLGNKRTETVTVTAGAQGVLTSGAGTLGQVDGSHISVKSAQSAGLWAQLGSTLNAGSADTENLEVTGGSWGVLALSEGSVVNLAGKNINVTSTADNSDALYVQDYGTIRVGTQETENITLNGKDAAIMALYHGGAIELTAKTIVMNSESMGVHVQNNSQDVTAPEKASRVNITGETIVLNSKELGFSAFSNGQMNVSGNLTATAANVIDVRGNSTMNINTDGKHTTVLNGDVVFETPNRPGAGNNSGNLINAYVNLGLHGTGSVWTGSAYKFYSYNGEDTRSVELVTPPYYGEVTGFTTEISNGGIWNVTDDSFVNTLNMQGNASIIGTDKVKQFNADEIVVSGAGNKLMFNKDTVLGAQVILKKDAELTTHLDTVFDYAQENGVVTQGGAIDVDVVTDVSTNPDGSLSTTTEKRPLLQFEEGSSLRIEDAVAYSSTGLNGIASAYENMNLVIDNATLQVIPDDTGNMNIPTNVNITLGARGEADLAGGATAFNVAGIVNIVQKDAQTTASLTNVVLNGTADKTAELNVENVQATAEKITVEKGAVTLNGDAAALLVGDLKNAGVVKVTGGTLAVSGTLENTGSISTANLSVANGTDANIEGLKNLTILDAGNGTGFATHADHALDALSVNENGKLAIESVVSAKTLVNAGTVTSSKGLSLETGNNKGVMKITGDLTASGLLSNEGELSASGLVKTDGKIQNLEKGTLAAASLKSNELLNQGTLTVTGAAVAATLDNRSKMNVASLESDTAVVNSGTFTTQGLVNAKGTIGNAAAGTFTTAQLTAKEVVNEGTMTVTGTADVAKLANAGSFTADVLNVASGTDTGSTFDVKTLNVKGGNFTLGADRELGTVTISDKSAIEAKGKLDADTLEVAAGGKLTADDLAVASGYDNSTENTVKNLTVKASVSGFALGADRAFDTLSVSNGASLTAQTLTASLTNAGTLKAQKLAGSATNRAGALLNAAAATLDKLTNEGTVETQTADVKDLATTGSFKADSLTVGNGSESGTFEVKNLNVKGGTFTLGKGHSVETLNVADASAVKAAEAIEVDTLQVEAGGQLSAKTLSVASGYDNSTANEVTKLIVKSSESGFALEQDRVIDAVDVQEGAKLTAKKLDVKTLEGKGSLAASDMLFGDANDFAGFEGDAALSGGRFAMTNDNVKRWFGGSVTMTGGTMDVTSMTDAEAALATLTVNGGSLTALSGQIFENALSETEFVKETGAKKTGATLTQGTLTIADATYNIQYAGKADEALKGMTIVFTGDVVSEPDPETPPVEKPETDLSVDQIKSNDSLAADNNVVFDTALDTTKGDNNPNNLVVGSQDDVQTSTQDANVVNKNVGVTQVKLSEGAELVAVNNNRKLTLVGEGGGDDLIVSSSSTIKLEVGGQNTAGVVSLGVNSSEVANAGTLNVDTYITGKGLLEVNAGSFTTAKTVENEGKLLVKADAALKVDGTLTLKAGSETTVEGKIETASGKTVTIETGSTLALNGDALLHKVDVVKNDGHDDAVITVGSNASAGRAVIKELGEEATSHLTFFLDPAWVEGGSNPMDAASSLVLNTSDFDGTMIVGQNSYAVFGTEADEGHLLDTFRRASLAWGPKDTTALAYVPHALDLGTDGKIVVDGSLTKYADFNAADATEDVKVAANGVLMIQAQNDLITGADALNVAFDKDAKLVVDGVKASETPYTFFGDNAVLTHNDAEVLATNAFFELKWTGANGVEVVLNTTDNAYAGLMQGMDLAASAMNQPGTDAYKYADDILSAYGTDRAKGAAAFDAAMNTAGAAAVFTTAYDRASELRDAVRGEALEGEGNRLWAQVTGGKTKLKGLSSGAQSIHVDTDAYGLVVGGDVALSNGVLGAAFTAGTGDSENDDVGVKDDFDFYGLAVYGKTAVGGIDLLADGSMTFVKSDLTMGGVADVDTDTTTAVYSLGVQARKTFSLAVDVTPFVGMDIYHVRGDGYDNGHGAQVDEAHATAVEFPIGATIAKAFETNGFKLNPNFSFAVVPTVGDRDIDSKVRFAGAQSTYNFTFADDVKVRTNLGFAAEKDNFRFGLNAGYDWGNEERSATKLMLNAQYRF